MKDERQRQVYKVAAGVFVCTKLKLMTGFINIYRHQVNHPYEIREYKL